MPRVTEAGKEIIRKKGEYYAKHPTEVVSQKQIHKDLIDHEGIKADPATIRICLKVGVIRAFNAKTTAEVKRALQVYSNLWPHPETKPEIQEKVRQLGEYYTLHPEKVASIKQIKRDFAKQDIHVSLETIRVSLRQGVARVVKLPSEIKRTCSQLWPNHVITREMKETVRQMGEHYVRHPEEAKAIEQIKQDLAENHIIISTMKIRKFLREGAIRALGPIKGPKMVHNLWPRMEVPEKLQEYIRQHEEFYARELKASLDTKSEFKLFPQFREITQDFRKQGIIVNENTVVKYLKQGVQLVVGPEKVAEEFYQLWPILLEEIINPI